jgi:hypothetical protein
MKSAGTMKLYSESSRREKSRRKAGGGSRKRIDKPKRKQKGRRDKQKRK